MNIYLIFNLNQLKLKQKKLFTITSFVFGLFSEIETIESDRFYFNYFFLC